METSNLSEPEEHNHFGLFLGNKIESTEDEDAFSIDADCEDFVTRHFGIRLRAEHATKPIDTWIVGIPFTWNVVEGLQLVGMPAVELDDGESNYMFRLGADYAFEQT